MSTENEEKLKRTIHDLEQRLEIALLCANQVWWEWDLPTGILKTHAIKDCILGYDLTKIRHHMDFWMDALPPEEREAVQKSLQEHLDGKTEMWVMEHQYRDPSGEYKWVLEAGKVVDHRSDGSPLRMVGITQNIHEKKLREQAIREQNDELTESLKLKDMVLTTVSHDVLNTLTSGWGMAQLLQDQSIAQNKDFRMIEESLSQSIKLITSIHELAKGTHAKSNRQKVESSTTLNDIRNFHAPDAKNKGLSLQVEAQEGNTTTTDELALRRILDNLVGNAIKFTDAGHVSILDLSTETEFIIEVRDSGEGIPPEKAHLLFTPFEMLTSNKQGSGLGTSISRDLAKRLAGTLTYRANTPQGSVFRLAIPRA